MELRTDQEFKSIIPPLTAEEYAGLEASIIQEGCRDALVTWQGVIVDGHNRYEICQRHGTEFKAVERHFENKDKVKEWIILNQFARRNLCAYQRSVLALQLEKLFREKAKEKQGKRADIPQKSWESKTRLEEKINQLKGMGLSPEAEQENIRIAENNHQKEIRRLYNNEDTKLYIAKSGNKIKIGVSIYPEERIATLKTGNADIRLVKVYNYGQKSGEIEKLAHKKFEEYRDSGEWFFDNGGLIDSVSKYVEKEHARQSETSYNLAKIAGVSHDTIAKVKKIEEFATTEIKEKLKKGQATIHSVYKKISQKKEVLPPELPKGKYDVILADPPWRYQFSETSTREIENQYPSMDLEDIKRLSIPAADNAVLFLWATAPKLEESLQVLNAWGFTYKTCAVWDKEAQGMGYWFRGQHELLLLGVKGNFRTPNPENRFSSVIREKRTEHSKKPERVYEIIETMFPKAKYIELFARDARPGWGAWGNEI